MFPCELKLHANPRNALSYVIATLLSYCVQPPAMRRIVITVPSGPSVGEIHERRASVKEAFARLALPTRASIRWGGPPRSYGVTKDAVSRPSPSATDVVIVQPTSVKPDPLTRFPSIVCHTMSTGDPGGNPPPVTRTDVPGGPSVGLNVRETGSALTAEGPTDKERREARSRMPTVTAVFMVFSPVPLRPATRPPPSPAGGPRLSRRSS